jgi:flagellar biosynthesis anti-sigma factor FlgM
MRIDFNQAPPAAPEPERGAASASANNTSINPAQASATRSLQGGSSGTLEDQAQISGLHAQVQTLATEAGQLPEVRQQRVDSLRQAILGGQYRPEAKQVASAIIQHISSLRQAA